MQAPEAMPWLREYIEAVNSELRELFPRNRSTRLENAVADALSARGKRVETTLALLWCEAHSGDYRPAIPLAVAYELAHTSVLVQDDIIGHSELRRGTKSIKAKYGLSTAILTSDLLLFNVPKMVARCDHMGSGKLARIFDLVGEACRATTWGEFIGMEVARGRDGAARDYEEMIRLKTSSLLSAPCASGALVGGATDEQTVIAGRFGEELGQAYQIQNYNKETSRLKGLIREQGSLGYANEREMNHAKAARELLGSVPDSKARSYLMELTDYLTGRYY